MTRKRSRIAMMLNSRSYMGSARTEKLLLSCSRRTVMRRAKRSRRSLRRVARNRLPLSRRECLKRRR